MAEPKSNELMEKIVSLCKRRGFIFQSSEIYGGINGFWDYGPLGAELKRNVKELWWRSMTQERDDVVGLEASIIMHPKIWEASGHVNTFADPMCDCLVTGKRFRADQVEPQSGCVLRFAGAVDLVSIQKLAAEAKSPERSAIWSRTDLAPKLRILTENSSMAFGERYHGGCIMLCGSLEEQMEALKTAMKQAVFSNATLQAYSAMDVGNESASVNLADGKRLNPAVKVAQEYYRKRGIQDPVVIVVGSERQENSQRFNPENGGELTPPRQFNLMFETYVGPVEDTDSVAYLRPETAQAIFAQFKTVLEVSRQKVPFGICQIGKAFRNEINPRNYTFRSREFEQMELEFFIRPDEVVEAISGRIASASEVPNPNIQRPTSNIQHPMAAPLDAPPPTLDTSAWGWEAWHKYWVEQRIRWYESIGLPRDTLVEYWQKPEELAHYARATVDILFKFPFSKRDERGELTGEELEGIAARSDFDLSQHQRFSGKPMGVFDEELKGAWAKLDEATRNTLGLRYHHARFKYLTKSGVPAEQAAKEAKADAEGLAKGQYIPHVIEPSAGVDRLILALICHAYSEDQAPDEKGKLETRVVMRFHPRVAPIKVAIFPLLKNRPELVRKAGEVRDLLRPHLAVFYDEVGAIGRRYRRQDEAGTPFGVTIDFDTLGEKGPELKDTVTLRDRDSMKQDRVKIGDLLPLLLEKVC